MWLGPKSDMRLVSTLILPFSCAYELVGSNILFHTVYVLKS